MALELFGRKDSVNVQKVMWLLGELGVDYEHTEKGGSFGGLDDDDFRAMTPFARVPVLKDGDFTLSESNAILRYLAVTQDGGEAFYPADPKQRAKIDMWMDFGNVTIFPEFITLFQQVVRVPAKDRRMNIINMANRRFQAATLTVGSQLGDNPWITGENLTLADIAIGTYMYRYYSMPMIKRSKQARTEGWVARLQKREAYDRSVATDYRHMFAG